MLKFYQASLKSRPLLTMSISTGIMMGYGDIIAQTALEKRHKSGTYDYIRTLRFLGFGCVVGGPIIATWYKFIDTRIPVSKLKPLKMLFFDQTLFAPTFISIFFFSMGVLKGNSLSQIKEAYKEDYLSVLKTNYKLWPATQLINFYLIPLPHRVLFANFISIIWNTYLAWRTQSDKTPIITIQDESP